MEVAARLKSTIIHWTIWKESWDYLSQTKQSLEIKDKRMALLQLSIIPIGTSTPNLGDYILTIQKRLSDMSVTFALNDMGTLIEGEAGDLLRVAAELHEIPFEEGILRVVTQITIDDRRDKDVKIGDKTQTLINKLSRTGATDV
jgi:uncharacterized protein (TIGR00106 family)